MSARREPYNPPDSGKHRLVPIVLIPVILSGGSGTRLWPVSRETFPKPFMRLGGELSLLQRTLQRALPLADGHLSAIVTNGEYFFKTREEIDTLPSSTMSTCRTSSAWMRGSSFSNCPETPARRASATAVR